MNRAEKAMVPSIAENMEDNTIKDLVSDMLSNIVLGDKPEEEQVKSTGLMSSLPGVRTPTQTQQQEQEASSQS